MLASSDGPAATADEHQDEADDDEHATDGGQHRDRGHEADDEQNEAENNQDESNRWWPRWGRVLPCPEGQRTKDEVTSLIVRRTPPPRDAKRTSVPVSGGKCGDVGRCALRVQAPATPSGSQ